VGLCFFALAFFCFAFGLLALFVGCLLMVLAFPCFVIGLFALPLCGAALTFFAAAKKVSKESGSHRQRLGVLYSRTLGVVRARSDPSRTPRS
jgi:membrane protein implicated in regulation of membrane protease activity